jgi:endoglucanase
MGKAFDIMNQLLSAAGPSGFEGARVKLISEMAAPFADEVSCDALGSLIARRHGEGKRIMLAAQTDTVGFLVYDADEDGNLSIRPLGTSDAAALHGKPVRFVNGVRGVIFIRKLKDAVSRKFSGLVARDDLYVDIGASKREEALTLCGIGSACVLDVGPRILAGGRICGPGADSCAGAAALLLAMEKTAAGANDWCFVFHAQGHLGARGAAVAVRALQPALAVICGAVQPAPAQHGLSAVLMDKTAVFDTSVTEAILAAARHRRIPCGPRAHENESAAGVIQQACGGVAVGGIGIPARYPGSAGAMCCEPDIEHAAELLAAAAEL